MEKRSRSYLQLIKPGITLSNTIAAAAGVLLGISQVPASWLTAIALVLGTAAIIGASCVVNNITDRNIDRQMKRTSKREIVTGNISIPRAIMFATLLYIVGFTLLIVWTNLLTALLGLIAVVWYVVIYGYAKRHTPWSTIIGAVTGALPPMAGYTAAVGTIDGAAIIIFMAMFFWQMPHFYAISIFRREEYAAGNVPVWTVKRTVAGAKFQMLLFVILFALTGPLLTIFGYAGLIFLIGYLALALYWVANGVWYYRKISDEKWARRMFGVSLLVLLGMCALIAVGGYIP